MKLRSHLLVLGVALISVLPVLLQCAHDSDELEEEYLEDDGEESSEDAAADQEEAAASDQEDATDQAETADAPAGSSGGDDFSAMLAAMVEQQKQAGVKVPKKKTQANKKSAATTDDAEGSQPMWVFVAKTWIFSTPATTGTKVKQLGYGEKVEVVAQDQDWVRLGDQQYVRAQDLTDRKARFGNETLTHSGAKAGKLGKGRKVKSATLAVRSAPRLSAKVVGYRKHNDTVTVVKDGWQGWTQIGPGQFVRSKYLYSGASPAVGSGDQEFVVKSQSLYIRSAPDRHSQVVGVLLQGNTVRVSETSDGWSRIGPQRFIRTKHLESLAH